MRWKGDFPWPSLATNRLADAFVYGNVLVGLCAWAWVKFTQMLEGLPDDGTAALAGWGTVAAYGYMRLAEERGPTEGRTPLLRWLGSNRWAAFGLLLGSSLLAMRQALALRGPALEFFLLLTAISLLYPLTIRFRGRLLGLRTTPGLKLLLIAGVWTGTTYLLPLLRAEIRPDAEQWLHAAQRLFYLMALTLPFDIRDLARDPRHVHSLPQLLGEKRARRLAVVFLILAEALLLFWSLVQPSFPWGAFLSQYLVMELTLAFIWYGRSTRSDAYFNWGMESLPLLFPLLYLIFL